MKTRLLVSGVLAAFALTACGEQEARYGNAATITLPDCQRTTEQLDLTRTISVDDLADDVQQALDTPTASVAQSDPAQFQRDLLGALVQGQALELAASCRGVSVSQSDVDEQFNQLRQQSGGEEQLLEAAAREGLNRELLLEIQRSRALSVALGTELTKDIVVEPADLQAEYQRLADVFDQVTVAQVQLEDEETAQALLPRSLGLTDEAFKDLVREQSLVPQDQETGGVVGPLSQSAFTDNGLPELGEAIFEAMNGDTLVVPTPQGAFLVRVLERDTQTLEEATPLLRQQLLSEQIGAAINAELARIDIDINPRFGTWDDESSTVVAPGADGERPLSVQPGAADDSVTRLGSVTGR